MSTVFKSRLEDRYPKGGTEKKDGHKVLAAKLNITPQTLSAVLKCIEKLMEELDLKIISVEEMEDKDKLIELLKKY